MGDSGTFRVQSPCFDGIGRHHRQMLASRCACALCDSGRAGGGFSGAVCWICRCAAWPIAASPDGSRQVAARQSSLRAGARARGDRGLDRRDLGGVVRVRSGQPATSRMRNPPWRRGINRSKNAPSGQAVDTLAHSIALAENVSGGSDLSEKLNARLRFARRAQVAEQLHVLVEHMPLFCAAHRLCPPAKSPHWLSAGVPSGKGVPGSRTAREPNWRQKQNSDWTPICSISASSGRTCAFGPMEPAGFHNAASGIGRYRSDFRRQPSGMPDSARCTRPRWARRMSPTPRGGRPRSCSRRPRGNTMAVGRSFVPGGRMGTSRRRPR